MNSYSANTLFTRRYFILYLINVRFLSGRCVSEKAVACQLCVGAMFTMSVLISAEYYAGEHMFMPLATNDVTLKYLVTRVNFQRDQHRPRRSSRRDIYREITNTHYVRNPSHTRTYKCQRRNRENRTWKIARDAPLLDKIHRLLSRKETKRDTPGFLEPSPLPRTANARRAIEPCRGTSEERNGMRKSIVRWEATYNIITRKKIAHLPVTLDWCRGQSSEVTFSLTILRDETYYYILRDRTRKRERERERAEARRILRRLSPWPISRGVDRCQLEARFGRSAEKTETQRLQKEGKKKSRSHQPLSPCCPIASLVLTERAERRARTRELSSLLDLASERDTCRSPLPQPGPFPRHELCVCVRTMYAYHPRSGLRGVATRKGRSIGYLISRATSRVIPLQK